MREATVKTLCELVNGTVRGDDSKIVSGIANLASAKSGDISFLNDEKYQKYLAITQASVVIIREKDVQPCSASLIVVNDPYLAYARIATYLTQETDLPLGVHPTAVISDTALVDAGAYIGANVTVESHAVIGPGVRLGANCFVGANVTIGENSFFHANVSIYPNTIIGRNFIAHSGCVLGADGFGLANEAGKWIKIPQIGRLIIGNDVEIGANTTIDRGAIDDTIIHDGVKIDNLVHIGHNVEIGDHTAIAGCVGIAGSTKIGKHCTIAGAAGVNGHIEITDNVHIGAMGMVTKSLPEAGQYASGIPLEPSNQWRRNVARFRQLDKLENRIKQLENELKSIKGS